MTSRIVWLAYCVAKQLDNSAWQTIIKLTGYHWPCNVVPANVTSTFSVANDVAMCRSSNRRSRNVRRNGVACVRSIVA